MKNERYLDFFLTPLEVLIIIIKVLFLFTIKVFYEKMQRNKMINKINKALYILYMLFTIMLVGCIPYFISLDILLIKKGVASFFLLAVDILFIIYCIRSFIISFKYNKLINKKYRYSPLK